MKKYELTDETIIVDGKTLHRIRAIKTFSLFNGIVVRSGELGGFVETENNLSQEGNSWVGGSAQVSGNAKVFGNAVVCECARVCEYARVGGNAVVCEYAMVCENARVGGDAMVGENAEVEGSAVVYDDALVYGKAVVSGNARVFGYAQVGAAASVTETTDYVVAGPAGSRDAFTTYLPKQGLVFCGCFSGSLDEFAAAVEKTHAHAPLYLAQYRAMVAYFQQLKKITNKD